MTAVLYIIIRNDLSSMNPGKAIAQGSHAANAFVDHFHGYAQEYNAKPMQSAIESATVVGFNEWEQSTPQGFGTVLTLEGKMSDITSTTSLFAMMGYVAGVVHDPTYPILDGEVVHHIPLDTCAYIFIPNKEKDEFSSFLLKRFPLHR
jgi:peptidyl-tRNA hydrolase